MILHDLGVQDVQALLTLSMLGRVGLLTVDSHTALHTETGVFFDVTLNEQMLPLHDVIEADDKAGIVRLVKRDADGMAYTDPETGHAAEEIRRGSVRFVQRSA